MWELWIWKRGKLETDRETKNPCENKNLFFFVTETKIHY